MVSMSMVMLMFLLLLLLCISIAVFSVIVVSAGYTAFCFVGSTFPPREFVAKLSANTAFVWVCIFGRGCASVFVSAHISDAC